MVLPRMVKRLLLNNKTNKSPNNNKAESPKVVTNRKNNKNPNNINTKKERIKTKRERTRTKTRNESNLVLEYLFFALIK